MKISKTQDINKKQGIKTTKIQQNKNTYTKTNNKLGYVVKENNKKLNISETQRCNKKQIYRKQNTNMVN